MGLQFVQQWKQNAPVGLVKTSSELDKTEQDLLKRCARHYYDLKDSKTMMKFVEAFQSINLMRDFLKHLNCLDDLMSLEEENGNFLEAADIAQQKGDLRRKSDLLEKSGRFEESSLLILWYVFSESLWTHGSKGWPLKQFAQKEELLTKAKKSAKNHSDLFYSFVCMEANILSNRDSSLSEMGQYLYTSQGHRSFRGEIIAVRRILDAHFYTISSMYEWNDELVNNLIKHPEVMISQNRVSVDTLFYLWKYWKDKIVELVDYLCFDLGQNVGKYSTYEDFILNYFGVFKNYCNEEIVYVVLNSGANWVKEIDSTLFWKRGDLLSIGAHNFVPVALSYFCSELLAVGIEVLATLKLLHIYSCKNSVSMFCPGLCLVHMFEIAKFLVNYKFPNCKYSGICADYVKLSTEHFYDYVFHIDWKKSLTKDMISLRGRKVSMDLLKEAAVGNINEMNSMTSGQMGRVVMMILGSGKHTVYFKEEIMKSFDGHPLWKKLIEKICWTKRSDFNPDLGTTDITAASNVASVVYSFCDVLEDNMSAHWRPELDYISPSCFLYLAERLLIMVSYCQGYFFTTKSSCVEWLIYEEWDVDSSISSVSHVELPLVIGEVYNILVIQVQKLLVNKHDTLEWIKNSNNNPEDYYRLLVLRLMVLLCLICVNSANHFDKLFSLLDRSDLCADLPLEFCNALRRRECYFIDALADALERIENPLVIVSLTNNFVECSSSNVKFLNMKVKKFSKDLFTELFPERPETITSGGHNEGQSGRQYGLFWEILDTLESLEQVKDSCLMWFMSTAPVIKVEVGKILNLLSVTIESPLQMSHCRENENLFMIAGMLNELKQLSFALDIRKQQECVDEKIQSVVKIAKGLQLKRSKLKPLLDHLFLQMYENTSGFLGEGNMESNAT